MSEERNNQEAVDENKGTLKFIGIILLLVIAYIVFIYMPSQAKKTTPTRSPSDYVRIVYEITGDGVSGVSVTLENDTGGTDQGDYKVPFKEYYYDFERGDFVYISAQIIQPTSGAGNITCQIIQNGEVIAEAKASGFASIATCSGSVE